MSFKHDNLNSLDLRSDFENNNIPVGSSFKYEGYVGNRPADFEGEEHEDDTWAIGLYDKDGNVLESYLYVSEFEYNQDVENLKQRNRPDNRDLAVRFTGDMVLAGVVKDCTDTNDDTEFDIQDAIEELLNELIPHNKAPE
jgi:hypothetical protein